MATVKKHLPHFFLFLLSILFVSGCDNLNFGGDIRGQLDNDLGVKYIFYETDDPKASRVVKSFTTGKTVTDSAFPKFVQDDNLLVGWKYYKNSITGSTKMPSTFSTNQKGYITSIRIGNSSESLYGIWKKKCTITFVTNMEGVNLEPAVIPQEDLLPPQQFETKQGNFRFWGWFTDSEFNYPFDASQPVMTDLTLYAKWAEVRTITYYKNDGSDTYREVDYEYNTSQVISDCLFGERSGYGFVGWAASPQGSVTHYFGDPYPAKENMSLYAVWSTDVVKVTYEDKSGNFESCTTIYGRGAHMQVGRALSNDNTRYAFLYDLWKITGKEVAGYSQSSSKTAATLDFSNGDYTAWGYYYTGSGSNTVEKNYITITADAKYYVYWDDIKYYLSYRYYDENGVLRDLYSGYKVVIWNQTAVRPTEIPLIPGHTFKDWYRAYWVGNELVASSEPFDFTIPFNEENYKDRYIEIIAKFTDGGNTTSHISIGGITFTETPGSDITVNETFESSTGTAKFTVSGSYTYYKWSVNGKTKQEGAGMSEFTVYYSDWSSGVYAINLIVQDSAGNYYSWQGKIEK